MYERLPGSVLSSGLNDSFVLLLIHVSTKSAFGHAIVRIYSDHPWAISLGFSALSSQSQLKPSSFASLSTPKQS